MTATWLSGPDGVVTNPAEPALPLAVRERDADGREHRPPRRRLPRRHVHRLARSCPLTGAPTTELRGVHAPFVSPVFFPMRLWRPSTTSARSAAPGARTCSSRRRSTDRRRRARDEHAAPVLEPRPATLLQRQPDRAPRSPTHPRSSASTAEPVPGGIDFTAEVVGDPAAAIQRSGSPTPTGNGTWSSLDLVHA